MVTVVIVLNLLIAALCWYATWRVWKLRRSLTKIADTLISAERYTQSALYGAPDAIIKGQLGIYHLRQRYQQLEPQLRQVQQALALLSIGQAALRQRRSPSRRHFTNKRPTLK